MFSEKPIIDNKVEIHEQPTINHAKKDSTKIKETEYTKNEIPDANPKKLLMPKSRKPVRPQSWKRKSVTHRLKGLLSIFIWDANKILYIILTYYLKI